MSKMHGKCASCSGVAALTASERRAIDFALAGVSRKKIGEKMFLSDKTIATYHYRALNKLEISSMRELPAWYMRQLAERFGLLVPICALTGPSLDYLVDRARKVA